VDSAQDAFNARLHYETGDIHLDNGVATIHRAGQSFRFLGAKDANRVLRAWGTPPADDALGMLVPARMSPVDSAAWAILITYLKDGYVPDTVAAHMPDALAMVDFDAGNRYADYVPGKDKVAAYGIGALILGGVVAAKFGS
jgi:uncharacterized membrane-anchored protein